jgi:hypothetical protein
MRPRRVRLLSPRLDMRSFGDIEQDPLVQIYRQESLDEVEPDLPDADEERRRRRRAEQVAREEALRLLEETQAHL